MLHKEEEKPEVAITVNGKDINIFVIDSLITDIRKKKEFSSIEEAIVFHEVIKEIRKSSKTTKILSERSLDKIQKAKEYKHILKEVRGTLHRLYGMYQIQDDKDRHEILDKIKKEIKQEKPTKSKLLELHNELMRTHSSTEERLSDYPTLYSKIFKFTKKPKSIIDVGCGFNPISLPYMNLKELNYNAMDISLGDVDFLKEYFSVVKKQYGVKGKASVLNLLNAKNENVFKGIRKVDVAFLFKVLEIVEMNKKHKISENIIETIPAKWVVVSFPTKTLTKKLMNHIRRGWMHRMLERLKYEYHIIKEKNELFFVIKKS
jgi:16S rRNA (guanine(1405)-N(7))-methyltransferase